MRSVLISSALVVIEAAVLWIVLARPKVELWKKSLLALGLAFPTTLVGLVMLMHSPPYFGSHVLWLVSVTLCLLALLGLAGAVRLVAALLQQSRRGAG